MSGRTGDDVASSACGFRNCSHGRMLSRRMLFAARTSMSVCNASKWALALIILAIKPAFADPMLADFEYPFEVKRFEFTSQKLPLSMAYRDVGADHKGAERGRLSSCRPGSDRLLQVVEA